MVVQIRSTGSSGGTAAGIVVLVISVIFMGVGILVPPIACVGCIMLIIGIIMISSTGGGSRAVIIQQQPAMVPMIPAVIPRQVVQHYPVAPQPAPVQQRKPAPIPVQTNVAVLAENAKNLEKARDFDAAANMYQKAGMFDDAGRVRQAHLEKEEAMVQIGQVGNKVLNDSVMVTDNTAVTASAAATTAETNICEMCQNTVEVGWNVCPHCQHRFDK
jgi:hypothetical protein